MQLRICAFFLLIMTCFSVQGQNTEEPPYLYYYSQMLGGLIIERADGTDSRLIAADVIMPGHAGINGPGWSPSGRYFAGTGRYNQNPFVINTAGETMVSFNLPRVGLSLWAPARDILLATSYTPFETTNYYSSSYWLIDVEADEVLVDYTINTSVEIQTSDFIWDMPNEQLILYIRPSFYDDDSYYRVTMQFDGTTLREPISESEFREYYRNPVPQELTGTEYDEFYGYKLSPSGMYEANGIYPTILTNLATAKAVELSDHTQGMICRDYIWHEDEDYIITLDGIQRAGGGCGYAMMGVTDSRGELWRELGSCSWDEACVGWLPDRIDVSSLPPGSDQPVQLDPVEIEYVEERLPGIVSAETLTTHLLCDDDNSAQIIDDDAPDTLYTLTDIECPYNSIDSFADEGLPIVIAFEPSRDLLATHHDYLFDPYVTIWQGRADGTYEQILRLNSSGYELAFTEDGDFLRARNINGWQVYAVEDILTYAERDS